jgi:uncharacterized protein (DUF608 family)
MPEKARPYSAERLKGDRAQRMFSGSAALQIAMPLGGIGAGCICLNGVGGLQDFSIWHKPANSALPDGHGTHESAFALLHIKGRRPVTRLVEGPMPLEKIYDHGLKAQGYRGGGHEGLPRFERSTFKGEYPFGFVTLHDPDMPLRVEIAGWNPFIPLDDRNSSIPCAILEYTLRNPSRRTVQYEFSFHLSHLVMGSEGEAASRNAAIRGAGVFFSNEDDPDSLAFGSASLTVVGHRPVIKAMWPRGGWFDSVSALWREVSSGKFRPNAGWNGKDVGGRNGGSIMMSGTLRPGARVTYPIIITWYLPNSDLTVGLARDPAASCGCSAGEKCSPRWRPYYVSQWKDAADVAAHVRENYESLRRRTQAFRDALFSSTLPSYVLDAVSANLAILKSPTVLRQENGNVWAWEGCFTQAGCCHGTCTHVWNYAQAMPHLFPNLERTLRAQELERSMDERGHVTFRGGLPDGPTAHTFHAAADGQLGGIMKVYRDWQIFGDRAWLERMLPLAKRSLDYCIRAWDPDHKGVLVEPHHNTYDIEFWGPDGMCSSIYLGALSAMVAMCRELGKPDDAEFYANLAARGAKYLDDKLFNGEYFEQKVMWKGLRDTSFAEMIAGVDRNSGEMMRLVKKEGPKYQYGKGCLADGVIGAWMAAMYGIATPQTAANVRKHLRSVFQHNFRADLADHACTQRPGYAWGHEPGLLLCTWPHGGKPTLPFPYSDEVWTGIEYQVASHLIAEGFVAEGLTIVRAARGRYDGHVRNPWNEYECGSYYARAMASYALLSALSGFRYSAPTRTLRIGPKLTSDRFRTFFSAATGYGTITVLKGAVAVEMVEGELAVDTLCVARGEKVQTLPWGITARPGRREVLRTDV